jgi:hypothetical protein
MSLTLDRHTLERTAQDLHARGFTVRDISEFLHLSEVAVRHLLGIPTPPTPPGGPPP